MKLANSLTRCFRRKGIMKIISGKQAGMNPLCAGWADRPKFSSIRRSNCLQSQPFIWFVLVPLILMPLTELHL